MSGGCVAFRDERFREIEQTPANRCIPDREIRPDQFVRLRLAQRVGFNGFGRMLGKPVHRWRAHRVRIVEKDPRTEGHYVYNPRSDLYAETCKVEAKTASAAK